MCLTHPDDVTTLKQEKADIAESLHVCFARFCHSKQRENAAKSILTMYVSQTKDGSQMAVTKRRASHICKLLWTTDAAGKKKRIFTLSCEHHLYNCVFFFLQADVHTGHRMYNEGGKHK